MSEPLPLCHRLRTLVEDPRDLDTLVEGAIEVTFNAVPIGQCKGALEWTTTNNKIYPTIQREQSLSGCSRVIKGRPLSGL